MKLTALILMSGVFFASAGAGDNETLVRPEIDVEVRRDKDGHQRYEFLRDDRTAQQSGTCSHGQYAVKWNRSGWSVRIRGQEAVLGEDFRAFEKVEVQDPDTLLTNLEEEVIDKSDPRRMQVGISRADNLSRLVYAVGRKDVGEMRRRVMITPEGVYMHWTYSSYGKIGGRGEIRVAVPDKAVSERGLTVVSSEGDAVFIEVPKDGVPESLREGLTAREFRINQGEFSSRWQLRGDTQRFFIEHTKKGLDLVLRFEYAAKRKVRIGLRLSQKDEHRVKAGKWRVELRMQRLGVWRAEDEIISSDYALVRRSRGSVDLATEPKTREVVEEQQPRTALLEIQTSSTDAGWLRRRMLAGEAGVRLVYDGALLEQGRAWQLRLRLGPWLIGSQLQLRYMDGRVETLDAIPKSSWQSDELVELVGSRRGDRISISMVGRKGMSFPWRLERRQDGSLELASVLGEDRRVAGDVILRAPEFPATDEKTK